MKKLIISLLGLAFSSVTFGYIVPQYVFVRCPLFLTCGTSKISSCGDSDGSLVPPFTKIILHEGEVSPGSYRIDMISAYITPGTKGALCVYVQNLSIKPSIIWLEASPNDLAIDVDVTHMQWTINRPYTCKVRGQAAVNTCTFHYK